MELTRLFEESSPTIKQKFVSFSSLFFEEELEELPFSSHTMYVFLYLVLFQNLFSWTLSYETDSDTPLLYVPAYYTRNW